MSARTVSACIAAVALSAIAACSKKDPPRQPAVPVSVTTVKRASVPYVVTANGVAEPMQTVAVESQVNGILNRVTFAEGQPVQAGQVLFEIDPRPYVAVLDQARAQLARDQAMAVSAQRDAVRYAALVKEGYVTGSQADQAEANAASAAATVAADRANVQKAALDVANTTIRAPISGRTGSLLVRQGNLVKANSTPPLVVINQIQPILVRFSIAQSQFPDIQRYYRGGNALQVRATPSEGSGVPLQGTLAFVDNNVDSTTGTVLLKARFSNPEGTMWPGQYMSVALQLYVDPNALTLPSPAVLTGQQGTYVYTIDTAGTARQRPVQVARTVDTVTVIASGLTDGERVIVDGQSRLVPGSKVAIKGVQK
ncbi:MAG TPA: efflux RND transporter periplasmic adaptor subunit [Gemmatimonadaceae bacterium]|jgi:membrane fusion protein, multidrug efflux system|nr:efflux RND transporter periplasmic adaptor subunit [Gemmatimonadaceae bacterium]